jgi:hypothetical protein
LKAIPTTVVWDNHNKNNYNDGASEMRIFEFLRQVLQERSPMERGKGTGLLHKVTHYHRRIYKSKLICILILWTMKKS